MTRRVPPSRVRPVQTAPAPRAESSGTGAGAGGGVFAGALPVRNSRAIADPWHARRMFPDLWAEFLHASFASHLVVAVTFGVCEKTARQWWEGTSGPQGWAVCWAHENVPGADALLRCAA